MFRRLVIFLILLLLFPVSPLQAAYPPEITGNFEWGQKHFDFHFNGEQDPLDDEMEDSYWYWKYYLRYQRRLKPYSYYYLRYEYQERDYSLRERYTSEVHQITGNLTYQLNERWRYYIQLNYRIREYPYSLSSYQALTPSLQLNYYPQESTTFTGRYQIQRRLYPEREGSNYDLQGLILTFRQTINPSLTINGRFRVNYKESMAEELLGDLETRVSVGFRYVMH